MTVKKKVAIKPKKKVVRKKAAPKKRGRPAGSINKKDTQKLSLLEYARKNGGQSPIEFLLDIQNGLKQKDGHEPTHAERVSAAQAAAPYCHPKLRSMEIKGEIIPATFIIMDA